MVILIGAQYVTVHTWSSVHHHNTELHDFDSLILVAQNHSCSPSMYTKVLEVDGQPRLVFFARADICPGQELTYDYRFKREEGDDKLTCYCGAPNCRGTMN